MTAIVGVYARRGCVGVCDARCYNAMQPSDLIEPRRNACTCICGGANHGMGEARALRNSVERAVGLRASDLEAFAQVRGFNAADLLVIDRLRANVDVARRMAKARLAPEPVGPDDLFYCEGLETAPADRERPLGPGAGTSQTVSPPGDLAETTGPLALSRR